MKLNLDRKWFEDRISAEDNCEVNPHPPEGRRAQPRRETMPQFSIIHHPTPQIEQVLTKVAAKNAGDALNVDGLCLPDWTIGCPIDERPDGTAVVEHPDEPSHYIMAERT